jgi:hypothetical protein
MRVLWLEQPPRTFAREWRIWLLPEGKSAKGGKVALVLKAILTHWLFSGAVVVIQLTAEQVQPFL